MTFVAIAANALSARQWFGIAVRCFGLTCFYRAMTHLLYFIDLRLGLSDSLGMIESTIPTGYLIYVVAYVSVGVFVLRTADSIVEFAYEPKESTVESTDKIAKDPPNNDQQD